MLPQKRHAKVTEEEYLALPETTERMELIDGEIMMPPSPTFLHQDLVLRLVRALAGWADAQEGPVRVVVAPADVRLRAGRIVQPDVFLVFGSIPKDHQGPLDQIPALCVEVMSNAVYDRVTKRYLYAEAGVQEYWVVHPSGFVERFSGPSLATADDITEGVLTTPLLPGFQLPLDDLFKED